MYNDVKFHRSFSMLIKSFLINLLCLVPCARCTIKNRINLWREVYKKVVNGQNMKDLWDEYCTLRKEVKELVREKKLSIWNEDLEKANVDFDGSKKEFWAFVGRKGKIFLLFR